MCTRRSKELDRQAIMVGLPRVTFAAAQATEFRQRRRRKVRRACCDDPLPRCFHSSDARRGLLWFMRVSIDQYQELGWTGKDSRRCTMCGKLPAKHDAESKRRFAPRLGLGIALLVISICGDRAYAADYAANADAGQMHSSPIASSVEAIPLPASPSDRSAVTLDQAIAATLTADPRFAPAWKRSVRQTPIC